MKYLIACDLDGTLLDDQQKICSYTVETLNKIQDQGHKIIITTGRPFHASIEFYNQLKLNTPMINDNGGTICHPLDETFKPIEHRIPLDVFHDFFNKTKKHILSALYTVSGIAYAYKYEKELERLFSGAYANKLIDKPFNEVNVEPSIIVMLVENNSVNFVISTLEYDYKNILSYRNWGTTENYTAIEIYKSNISKANALKELLDLYKMTDEQLITIGDGLNDLEMLSAAKIGIAMKNATEIVKKHADQVTKYTNNEDGVAKHFSELFDLKF